MDALFAPKTLSFLKEAIGGIEIMENKRVITSAIVLSVSEDNLDDLRIAARLDDFLAPPEDGFIFTFLRAYCSSILHTGKSIREDGGHLTAEPPTFFGEDMERYFYYGKDTSKEYPVSIDKLPAKPMFIMTRQMVAEELENIPFYKNLAFHHLVQQTSDIERKLKEPEFCDLLEKQRVSIVKDPIKDLHEALNYLINTRKYESVLVEAGPTVCGKYIEDEEAPESPFDLVILTIYTGKAKDIWYGVKYPSMKKLLDKHNLVHESKSYPCGEGNIRFYVLEKKKISS